MVDVVGAGDPEDTGFEAFNHEDGVEEGAQGDPSVSKRPPDQRRSDPMERVCCTFDGIFNTEELSYYIMTVLKMGGKCSGSFVSGYTTHVVCKQDPESRRESPTCVMARQDLDEAHIVRPEWLDECLYVKGLVDVTGFLVDEIEPIVYNKDTRVRSHDGMYGTISVVDDVDKRYKIVWDDEKYSGDVYYLFEDEILDRMVDDGKHGKAPPKRAPTASSTCHTGEGTLSVGFEPDRIGPGTAQNKNQSANSAESEFAATCSEVGVAASRTASGTKRAASSKRRRPNGSGAKKPRSIKKSKPVKEKISVRYMCKHLKCTVGKEKRCRGIVNITLRRGEPRPPLTNMPAGVPEDCDWETLVREHTRSVNRRSNDKTGASKEIEVDGTRPWYGRVGGEECFFLRERQKVRTHNNKEHNKVHPEEGYDRVNEDHGDLYVTDKGYDNIRYQRDKRAKMKATPEVE